MAISTKKKNSLKSKTRKHFNKSKSKKNQSRTRNMRGGSESIHAPSKVVVHSELPKNKVVVEQQPSKSGFGNWLKRTPQQSNTKQNEIEIKFKSSVKRNAMRRKLGQTPLSNKNPGAELMLKNRLGGDTLAASNVFPKSILKKREPPTRIARVKKMLRIKSEKKPSFRPIFRNEIGENLVEFGPNIKENNLNEYMTSVTMSPETKEQIKINQLIVSHIR